MHLRALVNQFVIYAGVGAIGTAAHYVTLLLFVEALGGAAYRGAVAGFIVGAVINYYLNYRLTFRSVRHHHEALPKFLVIATAGAVLTAALMAWATEDIHLHYFVAQIFTTALLLCLTFIGNRLWTFREGA